MKKSGVIWSVSQKQYNMLNEQYKELQKITNSQIAYLPK